MTIQSPYYFVFVLALWLLALPFREPKARQALLLVSSYVFYAFWGLDLLAILIASSLVNYACGALLRRRPTAARLWLGVLVNLSLLSFFKYLPLLGGIAPAGSSFAGLLHQIVLPVGISFWTFQALSYLFDLYREEDLNPPFMEFLLYMAFWPTVLSGPVCRLAEMLPQFRDVTPPGWEDVQVGARRILIGLAMKVVLAQILAGGIRRASGVTAGFDQMKSGWGGLDVWLLAVGFGFQLYFDFAGYSHIVIGSARLFGFRLPENFDRPYLSTTPSVFWTRWHMSLSFWIRDYLFLPLATLRRESWWRHLALLVSMVLFGIWHKGSVLFALWGVYHGVLLLIHRKMQQLKRGFEVRLPARLESGLSWILTYAAVSLGWVLFRANDFGQGATMLGAVVSPGSYRHMGTAPGLSKLVLAVAGGYFGLIGAYNWLGHRYETWEQRHVGTVQPGRVAESFAFLWRKRFWLMAPAFILFFLFGLLVVLGQSTSIAPFIYTVF
jgi:alginate O-acetyltransferase complex protein AlgI